MQNISSARAIVTGGASGLALGTAEYLANAGASVAMLDVQVESGRAAAAAAEAAFGNAGIHRVESGVDTADSRKVSNSEEVA
jgi:NAD(P)-dependent dehydrogenase (short-subunit alcohol dehydrogenase family)